MPIYLQLGDSRRLPHYYRMWPLVARVCPKWEVTTKKKSKEFCEEQFVIESSQIALHSVSKPQKKNLN
jgi:uncharacterized protein YbdZ (MbtH family)